MIAASTGIPVFLQKPSNQNNPEAATLVSQTARLNQICWIRNDTDRLRKVEKDMPFVDFATEDELKKKEDQTNTGQPTTQQSAALSANPAGGAQVGAGRGTGWTNLQPYLNNNAGQGMATTQQVLGGKQKQIDSAVNSLTQDANTVKGAATSGTVQRNTALENQIKSNPAAIDKNAYNAYTQSAYKGPTQYAPSVDVEKQWQNLPTQTTLAQTADPTTIGKSLGKSEYGYGLGKLDSYLMQSEGAGAIDTYNTKNKDVTANRTAAVGDVNSAIKNAQQQSTANVQGLRDTTNQAYKDTLARAQATKGTAQTAAYDKAYGDVQKRFADAGVDAPGGITGMSTYIRPTEGYDWQDSVDPETLAALNSLADIDENQDTNPFNRGTRNPLSVDWKSLEAYLSAATPGRAGTPGAKTSADGVEMTDTGVVEDQYGNRIDDGLTAAEIYDRLNKTKKG